MVTFLGLLVQSCCGEGGTLQANVCRECSQCLSHTGFAPAHSVYAFPVYTAQALGCSAGNCLMWALGCVHFSSTSPSVSFTRDAPYLICFFFFFKTPQILLMVHKYFISAELVEKNTQPIAHPLTQPKLIL